MAKKSKRGGQGGQSAQQLFRRILADTKHAHELVGAARTQVPVSSFSSMISLLKQSPNTRRVAFNPEYPKEYKLIKNTEVL